ncbi:MAG TPA: alpha/beta hydrolase [Kofleriaceae bacterium]|nr:alpha/beta hydrolase [Kofleriaceae bacterium]
MTIERVWVGPPRTDRPELVFLHEGLGSITLWRDTPEAIARATGCAALVYARRGYGRSSPVELPRPLTYMHDEASVLRELLAEEGVRAPIVIGHSDGASIAIIAAGGGLAVTALVLIAPHVFVEDISVRSIALAAEAYRSTDLRERLAKHHADVDNAFWGWNRVWLDPAFRAWNLEQFLPHIVVPMLVVQGSADEYGTIAQVDAITAQARGPVATLVVPGAGHSPQRTHPAEVHARIAEFVREAIRRRDR